MGKYIVLGSGIIGIYTALLLSEAGLSNDVIVVARNLPGDLSIDYTSPTAGAHFSFDVAGSSKELLHWCAVSYSLLKLLFAKFENELEEAGLDSMLQTELSDSQPDPEFINSLSQIADDFRVIKDADYLDSKGAVFGMQYQTFNFYPPKLLVFLQKYLEKKGVKFVRQTVSSISEASKVASASSTEVVFNCTGVLVSKLSDVKDDQLTYPIRGQVVTVKAPWVKENIGIKRLGMPPTYIIPRAHSGGLVILGGYYDKGDSSESTFSEQTKSIISRTTKLYPDLLKHGPLEIVGERAGLRPGRDNGPRIEKEVIGKLNVIHNYGAAGTGFQCGLGMAQHAVNLYFGSTEHKARL